MNRTIAERLSSLDWGSIRESLWRCGSALTPVVMTPAECNDLVKVYASKSAFRSHIVMARFRFGSGE